jgi:parvulin-like peptidyl-prolyl isomerase
MRKLARMAEADKLDQSSPTKEQLEFNRTMTLGQAMMNSKLNTLAIGPGEIAKYYEANKEQYKQVRVKALYISFGDSAPAGKQSRTEEQARDEAAKLLAQIREGADFVKLVKERSDDQTSREKDGDFATFHKKDNVPDAIAAAVFALKQGDVSEPIRQPNGYYLLRAEEVDYIPESQLQSEIIVKIRGQLYNQWLAQNTASIKVEFPNPAFPGTPAAPGK